MNDTADISATSTDRQSQSAAPANTSARKTRPVANSSVAGSKRKLESAITNAEEHLQELRNWIAAHAKGSDELPSKTPATLSTQLKGKLEKVATFHGEFKTAQTKAASTTVASVISTIGPNVDLQEIDDMMKAGRSPREIVAQLNKLLIEAVDG